MKTLPKHLKQALEAIVAGSGDDIYFVLGYLSKGTARSYVSELKKRNLAYTYCGGSTCEVWPTDKGKKII